ncbi:unnamed protein product [Citrullus colocynthis]|uniref:Uncharacterized protein n=1 Tax=Citrullus colocynthis TaxID=252529 RepID=A0ABP0YGJ5_9ROSI
MSEFPSPVMTPTTTTVSVPVRQQPQAARRSSKSFARRRFSDSCTTGFTAAALANRSATYDCRRFDSDPPEPSQQRFSPFQRVLALTRTPVIVLDWFEGID